MKVIILILLITFWTSFSFGQTRAILVPASFINLRNVSIASSAERNHTENTFDEDCHRYRVMKVTGIVLLGAGGGLVAAGATSFSIGVAVALGEHPGNQTSQRTSVAPLFAGMICMGLGTCSMIAGVPVTIIGVRKSKKHCNTGVSSHVELSTKGNGLALNF